MNNRTTCSFLGDIAFTGILSTNPENNIYRFDRINPILKDSEINFANLEVPLQVDKSRNEYKNFIHYSLPEPSRELLKMLNIGCVSLANNHIYDCKMSGLKATIEMLDKLGIFYTGAGWKKEHCDPVVIHKEDINIGFLAYVDKCTNPKTENFSELFINYFELNQVKKDVFAIKNKVDKIICSIHWGKDYSFYPTRDQIKVARELIDSGVDIIMGHHPHTLQPFEHYKSGIIFYSLGGLTFGDFMKNGKIQALYRKTKKGVIVKCDLSTMLFDFISTVEKKGNFIQKNKKSFSLWSKKKWILYHLKERNNFSRSIFNFYEKVLYRVYEYFFGYYQKPLSRLFQIKNLKKVKRLFKK